MRTVIVMAMEIRLLVINRPFERLVLYVTNRELIAGVDGSM
jgi:hypothetical protein